MKLACPILAVRNPKHDYNMQIHPVLLTLYPRFLDHSDVAIKTPQKIDCAVLQTKNYYKILSMQPCGDKNKACFLVHSTTERKSHSNF
ncbi:hypothetical protein GCM10022258_38300 [Aquimarina gracilis]